MTLLDLIIKAAGTNGEPTTTTTTTSKFPLTFNPDLILPNLKPESENPNNRFYLVEPLNGFQISDSNLSIVDYNSSFMKKLHRRLSSKSSGSLSSAGFVDMMIQFLEKIASLAGLSVDGKGTQSGEAYTQSLFEAVGKFVSRDVIGLVIESCVSTEIWGVLETLIVNKLVAQTLQSALLSKLAAKNCSDLVCLCIKHFSDDLNWSDLLGILKYFLSPSNEARVNMASIRKTWEDDALLAIKVAGDKKLAEKKRVKAKEAAVLLMVAYDGFSGPELCLHYLLSSTKMDDMVFSGAISKLSLNEILGLIRYLGKWLKKYERFPQAIPCPDASKVLGLNSCQWVPTVEAIADSLAVVLDEWFSSLVLHSEFHPELKSIEGVLSSLVVEGRLCGSVANLIEICKTDGNAS